MSTLKILGISAYYHDSAASLMINGEIIAAAHEERFTQIKNDASFPINAIKYCLSEGMISLFEIDYIVYYEKPFLKFERILQTYIWVAPKGLRSFCYSMPKWINDKLFFKSKIRKDLRKVEQSKNTYKIYFSEHHHSHAALAYHTSKFEESVILSIDAAGEWETTVIFHAKNSTITKLASQDFPNSIGLLYSAFTFFLGFKVNSGEYKLMGLAAYGNTDSNQVKKFKEIIKKSLIKIDSNGFIELNQCFFSFTHSLKMINERKWVALFGFCARLQHSEIKQEHCDLALAIQETIEEVILSLASYAKDITNSNNLCLTGGVALNCALNGRLVESGIFKNIHVPFSPGDAGSSIGACFALYNTLNIVQKVNYETFNPYLGPHFTDEEIKADIQKFGLLFDEYLEEEELLSLVAKKLSENKLIGWFQGRAEFGARALGNRSILADPRNIDTQKRINLGVKFREHFRPFAPSILQEYSANYFENIDDSYYMQFVNRFKKEYIQKPIGYEFLNIDEKLNLRKSPVPAVTHVDFSARTQIVSKQLNPRFWGLINAFNEITGCPMLLNTSFNVRGKPIVGSPEDAIKCFKQNNLDILVLNNYIITK